MIHRSVLLALACLVLLATSCSADDGGGADGPEPTAGTEGAATTGPDGAGGETEPGEGTDGTDREPTPDLGNGAEPREYVDALAGSMQANATAGGVFSIGEDDAACLAERWLAVIDPERLAAAGLAPADLADVNDAFNRLGLTPEDGIAFEEAIDGCGIDLTGAVVDAMGSELPLTAADKACLAEHVTPELTRRVMMVTLTLGEDRLQDDPVVMDELLNALFACPGATGMGG